MDPKNRLKWQWNAYEWSRRGLIGDMLYLNAIQLGLESYPNKLRNVSVGYDIYSLVSSLFPALNGWNPLVSTQRQCSITFRAAIIDQLFSGIRLVAYVILMRRRSVLIICF